MQRKVEDTAVLGIAATCVAEHTAKAGCVHFHEGGEQDVCGVAEVSCCACGVLCRSAYLAHRHDDDAHTLSPLQVDVSVARFGRAVYCMYSPPHECTRTAIRLCAHAEGTCGFLCDAAVELHQHAHLVVSTHESGGVSMDTGCGEGEGCADRACCSRGGVGSVGNSGDGEGRGGVSGGGGGGGAVGRGESTGGTGDIPHYRQHVNKTDVTMCTQTMMARAPMMLLCLQRSRSCVGSCKTL